MCIACESNAHTNHNVLPSSTTENSSKTSSKKRKTPSYTQDQVRIKNPPLNATPSATTSNAVSKICSGINGLCTQSAGEVTFDFRYLNEKLKTYETIKNIQAKVIDTSTDAIIGRPDIIEYDMLSKLCNHFGKKRKGEVTTRGDHSTHDVTSTPGQPSVPHDHPALNLLIRKDDLLTPEEDDDGIELKVEDYLWELEDDSVQESGGKAKPLIVGSDNLRRKLEDLLEQFKDIFSEQPLKTPAKLEPMEFELDIPAWHRPRNRLPPRTQTRAKEYEIDKLNNCK